jgi:Transposase IS4
MIQLRLVKTASETNSEEANADEVRERESLLHGTRILKELVEPWAHSDRVICADSYFSSVSAVEELTKMQLRFIGVVKTATRKYPMHYLSNLVLYERGARHGVVAKDADGNVNMLAFVWMDRDRRYFIASAGSLAEGEPNVRTRWRQVAQEENAEPTRVELTIPQPRAAEIYYKVCSKVDQHNRSRQAFLNIEKN